MGDKAKSKGKLSHLKLQRVAKDKPGRLAAKKLQEMSDTVGDHGVERQWKKYDTPAAARSYYLRVIKPELGAGNVRAGREMKTLCHDLDQLALGRYAQASDILVQRLKAVHTSVQDGHWNMADHLELVPSDLISMTSLAERDMANQEPWCIYSSLLGVGPLSSQEGL